MDANDNTDQSVEDSKLKFKDDIFSALDAGDISDEEKGALMAKMADLVDSRTLDRVLDRLSGEDKAELEKIADNDDTDAFDKFITEKVPDYSAIFEEEAGKLRQELIIDLAK